MHPQPFVCFHCIFQYCLISVKHHKLRDLSWDFVPLCWLQPSKRRLFLRSAEKDRFVAAAEAAFIRGDPPALGGIRKRDSEENPVIPGPTSIWLAFSTHFDPLWTCLKRSQWDSMRVWGRKLIHSSWKIQLSLSETNHNRKASCLALVAKLISSKVQWNRRTAWTSNEGTLAPCHHSSSNLSGQPLASNSSRSRARTFGDFWRRLKQTNDVVFQYPGKMWFLIIGCCMLLLNIGGFRKKEANRCTAIPIVLPIQEPPQLLLPCRSSACRASCWSYVQFSGEK